LQAAPVHRRVTGAASFYAESDQRGITRVRRGIARDWRGITREPGRISRD
jgi:hypothetical protein